MFELGDGHMIAAKPFRESARKLINIDTRFCDEYADKVANYNITLSERVVNVKSMRVYSCELPLTFYAFSAARNNTSFTINNTTVTIPDSSGSNLINDITANLPVGMTITYTNNRVTITNSTGSQQLITFSTFRPKTSLGWALGFKLPKYIVDNGASIVGEGVLNINIMRYLYIAVDDYRSSTNNSFMAGYVGQKILARISLDNTNYGFGTVLPANMDGNGYLVSDVRTYSSLENIQKIQVKLVDEWGCVIDNNQSDFSFCLELEIQ